VIDSVAVYDTALSATDVAKLWDTADKSGYHLTTKEYDADIGLYYFWQRWYDPTIGRFTQAECAARDFLQVESIGSPRRQLC
jgi:RHS repeat-associated protein